MKKFKVTYQNKTGFHIEELSIILFAHNEEQAKTTAWIRLNREGKSPVRITDNWATVKKV